MHTPGVPCAVVEQLADLLEERGVSYCHWKSNHEIARSERGENDLDLLVDRKHATSFREVLSHAGFTRAERRGEPLPAGKEDYVAFDEASGKLVHVDAHYRLVLGHDRSKNYRIPLETAFLESAQRRSLLRQPSAELEFVVFVTRMVLKYAIWDEALWQALRGHRPGLKASEREELAHLESAVDPDRLAAVVVRHAPWFGDGLWEDSLAVSRGEVSLVERLRTGARLHHRLTSYATRPELVDGPLRLQRRIRLTAQRRFGGVPRFRLASGGAVVALIGGDGSGKTTAVEGLSEWLGDIFDVRQIHLGKPDWSLTTTLVRAVLKVGTRLAGGDSRSAPTGLAQESDPRAIVWLACTARDRYRTYRKARRFADRGGLIISDRFPHPELTAMDGPLIASLDSPLRTGRLGRALEAIELRYHRRIEHPELIVVLRVDPETAAQRKTTEPSGYVKRRVATVSEVDWEAAAVPVVDATRPASEVVAELRSLVWEALT